MKNRNFMYYSPGFAGIILLFLLFACREEKTVSPQNYTDFVDVFIGTGGHGHVFPGATLPHGMVQLSPDTRLFGWDGCSGYHYSDNTIIGFSHTHLSGTGIGDYGDILLLPVTDKKELKPALFSHQTEWGKPGYYKVNLIEDNIDVELTATTRAGFHKYNYNGEGIPRIIIDMAPTIHGHDHPITIINIENDSTISGLKYTEGWAKEHYVFFYASFSRPFTYELYAGNLLQTGERINDPDSRAILTFDLQENKKEVLVKVGISSVDMDGARKNLEQEISHWDFEKTAKEAEEAWNTELSKIEITTSDEEVRTIFYTALYHTAIAPCIASDVDGRYRTMNHTIEQDSDYTNYTIFSLWDTFRTLHPLFTIIKPDINQEFIRTLLKKYDESGILPKWELASNETGTMIGYHAVSVIADAYMKGQRDFDTEKALKASIRSSVYDTTGISPSMDREILYKRVMPEAIRYKNELGFIPADLCGRSVSQGLEFAYNDWQISELADQMGKEEIAKHYRELSKNYANYFDSSTGLMRGRTIDKEWVTPFDPRSLQHGSNYTEGNAWQWAWFVPHDVKGLMNLMGGPEAFETQLDSLFLMTSELTGESSAALDVTGMIGQYAHGNEPSHHIPYMYNFVGKPEKSQALIDSILYTLYHNDPDGLCGNEDCGQMSAWYIMSALGFYPFCPGTPVYQIGRPIIDDAVIHLPDNNTLRIKVKNNSRENKFVKSVKFNGKKINNYEISHSNIMQGGILEFEMIPGK